MFAPRTERPQLRGFIVGGLRAPLGGVGWRRRPFPGFSGDPAPAGVGADSCAGSAHATLPEILEQVYDIPDVKLLSNSRNLMNWSFQRS